jgi:Pyridoxamine 5'-phosphate oxidase
LDEIRIHLVPVLLGKGKRLFDHLGNQRIDLERTSVVEAPEGVIHLRFHVARYLPARSTERSGMTDQQDLEAIARAIIDANQYMTLGTANEAGRPWVSPVWYALAHYREFFWVSSPEATHSRNLVARPQLSIVIFDSRAPIGTGQGVYMSASAEKLAGVDLDRGVSIFSRRSEAHGASEWKPEDVRPPALHRLYRATAEDHWVLDPAGHPIHGRALDYRTPVTIEAGSPDP